MIERLSAARAACLETGHREWQGIHLAQRNGVFTAKMLCPRCLIIKIMVYRHMSSGELLIISRSFSGYVRVEGKQ